MRMSSSAKSAIHVRSQIIASARIFVNSPSFIETSGSGRTDISGASAPTNKRNLGRIRESPKLTTSVFCEYRWTVVAFLPRHRRYSLLFNSVQSYRAVDRAAIIKNSDWVKHTDLSDKTNCNSRTLNRVRLDEVRQFLLLLRRPTASGRASAHRGIPSLCM